MSLSVTLVDKQSQLDLMVPNILIDDTIQNIKEKLFCIDESYIPNLTKLEIKESGSFIILRDSMISHFTQLPVKQVLYVSSALTEILQKDFTTIFLRGSDSVEYLNEISAFKSEYIDMSDEDFDFVIKYAVYTSENDEIAKNDLEAHVQNYITKMSEFQQNIVNKVGTTDPTLQSFYELANKYTLNLNDDDDSDSDIKKEIYGNMDIVLKPKNVDDYKTIFIKVQEVFNVLELSDDIPFIALGKKYASTKSNDPLIKVHNNLIEKVGSREIKSWVLNEKKKVNQASYKIIKGLLIKCRMAQFSDYLTLNIMPNGLIYVNVKVGDQDETMSLKSITEEVYKCIDKVIEYINSLQGVFLYSRRLSNLSDMSMTVESLDITTTTNFYVDRKKLTSLLKLRAVSENVLELKPTESLDILSLYYPTEKSRANDDIKGITVNIKDNPYNLESSIITVFGAENVIQSRIIVGKILILTDISVNDGVLDFNIISKKRLVKEKSNKKLLKESGVNFDSRRCQGKRQPILVDLDSNHPKNKIITFMNKTYKCDNESFPYPGFTNDNIVCCFKNNQVGNESYIRNIDPDSLNILVKPSNFKVKVTVGTKEITTFVIKIVSEYYSGFDETNSASRYYYLSGSNQTDTPTLIPIKDEKLIEDISVQENQNEIWLETVSLSQIIYPSATNKCNFQPDFNSISDDVNGRCQHHPNNKFFGYSTKAIPCCFDKERPQFITRKNKESDITKQYIMTSDKILNYQKIGVLQNDLNKMFNNILTSENSTDSTYYRMGVIQNNSSFLNVILLGIDNILNNSLINGVSDFKNIIVKYLLNNPDIFTKMNNGFTQLKYGSIEKFQRYILDNNNVMHWNDLIDLIEHIIKCNVIIIDTFSKTRIACRQSKEYSKTSGKYFIILKNKSTSGKDTFELVIKLTKKSKSKNEITKTFEETSQVIKFLVEYYEKSCIKENVYPENYPYNRLYDFDYISRKFNNDTENLIGKLQYQVLNAFNRVNFLMTSKGILIPIIERGVIESNLRTIDFKRLLQSTVLLSLDSISKTLKVLNKYIYDKPVSILGIMESNIANVGGVLTSFGIILPYKKTIGDITNFEKLDFKYYVDIDEVLKDGTEDNRGEYVYFKKNVHKMRNTMFDIKKIIGYHLSKVKPEVVEYIKATITNPKPSRMRKIDNLVNIFKQFKGIQKSSLSDTKLDIVLKSIANEMLNDNKENLLLHNIVTSESYNKNEVVKRDNESVLLNINDIFDWIRRQETY